jgi:ADP-heptose:LPS heptosyltransferase
MTAGMEHRETPDRVLVYSGLELMGDGLMKLGFVRTLRAAFPKALITWLAGKGRTVYAHELRPLVEGLIDEVIERAQIGLSWSELLGRPPLDGRAFDLLIDTQSRVKTALLVRRIRHSRIIAPAAGFLFSDAKPDRAQPKPAHLNERLIELVELATGAAPPPPADLVLPAEDERAAIQLLPLGPFYVGLVPGAGGRAKRWPLDRFIGLARAQKAMGRVPVFILGPGETELQTRLAEAVPEALFPLGAAEDLGIAAGPLLTIALARRLGAGVANDSGGGHLLAAGGTPLVSLFGPSAYAKFAPAAAKLRIVAAQQFGGAAMELIPLDAVARTLEALLSEG